MLCDLPRRFETRWVAWRRMFSGECEGARCRHASLCAGAWGAQQAGVGFATFSKERSVLLRHRRHVRRLLLAALV